MDQQGESEETDHYLDGGYNQEEVADHSEGSGDQEEGDEVDNHTEKFHILEPRENSVTRGQQNSSSKPSIIGRRPQRPPPSNPNHNNVTENNASLKPTEVAPKVPPYLGDRYTMNMDEGNTQQEQTGEKMLVVNMKRFILCGLGVPGIPEVSKCTQTVCSKTKLACTCW